MPRENSFTDSEGRSLTPDMDDDALGPNSPINSSNAPFTADTAGTWATPTIRESPVARPPSKRSVHSRIKSLTSHPSLKSPTSRVRADTWPASGLTPLQRFRAAVRKIIVMQRGTSHLAGINRVGAEPGVYPRRASANILYGHIHQECVIEVVDYSSVRSSVGRMTNAEFIDLMGNPEASAKEPWVKVRWINIGGVSWDVIKAVSIKYDLHPLSLESVFNERSQNRSKADYYSRHLFLRVLCHELNDDEDDSDTEHVARGSTLTGLPRSYSPASMLDTEHLPETMKGLEREDTMYDSRMVSASSTMKRRRFFPIPLLPSSNHDLDGMGVMGARAGSNSSLARLMSTAADSRQKRAEQEVTLEALKEDERVKVKVSPMFIFLLRDGTVISIHTDPNLEFTSPISKRLQQIDTGLRTSADPSLLVHALLDIIVDNALEVIDSYHAKISQFERAILMKPNMKTVRHLHILSGDLILHKRTLEPIKTLIYGLRRYDVDRCAALVDMSDPANANVKIVGFMSHKSKIYLADVFDHTEYILSSLDMFAGIAENLIAYTFNLASYEMNQVMRRLTLATIIFLPLTLLTGYFGMNFKTMFSVDEHSDLFFWQIALPLMVIIVPMFMWSDIKSMVHYIQKRMRTREALKTFKQA